MPKPHSPAPPPSWETLARLLINGEDVQVGTGEMGAATRELRNMLSFYRRLSPTQQISTTSPSGQPYKLRTTSSSETSAGSRE